MAESHVVEEHGGAGIKPYLAVFTALVVFTLASFLINYQVREHGWSTTTGFALILGVAVCKAVLVATFFMHLNHDWGRFYFVIIPVLILGTLMVVVLLPDIVLAWHRLQ